MKAPASDGWLWRLIQVGLIAIATIGAGLFFYGFLAVAGAPSPDVAGAAALGVQFILAGISALYTAITGAIFIENRQLRLQTIQPHLQLVTHGHSDAEVTVELENSGAGPAVEVRAFG